jgi:hypothetical protein
MALPKKLTKAVMRAAPTALSAALPLPSSAATAHTGELGRAFKRAEATRALKQVKGSGRSTSGGHRPTRGTTDYGPKRSTTPNVMRAAGHSGRAGRKA